MLRPTLPSLFRPLPISRSFSSTPAARVAKITVIGRLAADPELFTTSNGQEIVRYAVGTSHGKPDETGNRDTSWWRVASFAEGDARQRILGLPKGSLVYVEGDARMRKFDRDGKTESALSIVQQKLEVLKRNNGSENAEEES